MAVVNNDVNLANLPGHIAVIMDGNGRWAKHRMFTRAAGHRAGAQTLKKLSEKMNSEGFKVLTVYTFSTENWTRDKKEVDALMNLLRKYIRQYIDDSKNSSIKLNNIGDISRLPKDLQEDLLNLKEITKDYDGLCVNFALNYGGRDEIVRAVRKIISNKTINAGEINENVFASYLDTAEFPDPDIIIRTGGEMRLSNFLLWQSAYSELFCTDKLWPDFTYADLLEIVSAYQKRERKYGGVKEQHD